MTAIPATAPIRAAADPGALRAAGLAQALTLILVGLMPALALAGLVPDLPQLFQHFAAEPNRELLVPMIITVPSLCVALFSGFAGAIADRWGRRRLLLVRCWPSARWAPSRCCSPVSRPSSPAAWPWVSPRPPSLPAATRCSGITTTSMTAANGWATRTCSARCSARPSSWPADSWPTGTGAGRSCCTCSASWCS